MSKSTSVKVVDFSGITRLELESLVGITIGWYSDNEFMIIKGSTSYTLSSDGNGETNIWKHEVGGEIPSLPVHLKDTIKGLEPLEIYWMITDRLATAVLSADHAILT